MSHSLPSIVTRGLVPGVLAGRRGLLPRRWGVVAAPGRWPWALAVGSCLHGLGPGCGAPTAARLQFGRELRPSEHGHELARQVCPRRALAGATVEAGPRARPSNPTSRPANWPGKPAGREPHLPWTFQGPSWGPTQESHVCFIMDLF
jgi:hypothetical protein